MDSFHRKKRDEIWRKKNKHNETYIINNFNFDITSVGKETYGPLEVYSWNSEGEGLEIGNYVSIAKGVKFLLGGNHNSLSFLTFPIKVKILKIQTEESLTKGKIIIEDDVWLGMDSIIMSGVRIGKGAIVGAGSVVTKDVLPFQIVAGNPAKMIRERFPLSIVEKLMELDYSKITLEKIKENFSLFEEDLTEENLLKLEKILKDN